MLSYRKTITTFQSLTAVEKLDIISGAWGGCNELFSVFIVRVKTLMEQLSWGSSEEIYGSNRDTVRIRLESGEIVELYTPRMFSTFRPSASASNSLASTTSALGEAVRDTLARSLHMSQFFPAAEVYDHDSTNNNPLGTPYILFQFGTDTQDAMADIYKSGTSNDYISFVASVAKLQKKMAAARSPRGGKVVASGGSTTYNISPTTSDVKPLLRPLDGRPNAANLHSYLPKMASYLASKPLNATKGFNARVVHDTDTNKALLNLYHAIGELA